MNEVKGFEWQCYVVKCYTTAVQCGRVLLRRLSVQMDYFSYDGEPSRAWDKNAIQDLLPVLNLRLWCRDALGAWEGLIYYAK